MAIYQRDRDFHRLFSEIDIDVIPLRFVKDVTCHLTDGKTVVLNQKDFSSKDLEEDHLENLIKDLDFYEDMADLSIRINYERVERDVGSQVDKILNGTSK